MEHIVLFEHWCQLCKYRKTKDTDSPCDDCLSEPVRTDTTQPVNFEAK